MKKIIASFLFCICFTYSFATHIVGGHLGYTYLGHGDWYKITLTLYRDCQNGVPAYDNPARVAIFNQNGVFVDSLNMYNVDSMNVPIVSNNPCLVMPVGLCVSRAVYTDSIQLPAISGGYTLAYQRCCRNAAILNIMNPTAVGATYSCFISETALLQHNSSPVFSGLPNPVICNNNLIDYDHSATDVDGDRLVYKLCTPHDGASQASPIPTQSAMSPPPYTNIIWQPPFDINNMLGGSAPLNINAITGRLTGTPSIIGQFVVGVCIDEYRNNALISTTKRDFQYNVAQCGNLGVTPAYAINTQCGNTTVSFANQTVGAATSYEWDFGVQNSTNDTSSLFSPTYTFPDTGSYVITLTVHSANQCNNIRSELFHLGYVTITQNGNDLIAPQAISYQWFLNDVAISGATQQIYTATQLGVYTVVVVDNAGCASPSLHLALRLLSTEDKGLASKIGLSPNPATHILTISLPDNYSLSNVEIYNEIGQLQQTQTQNNQINIANLTAGLYFAKISVDDRFVMMRFVKM